MEPSPQAREWGKRQAAKSPRWTEAKWTRIATIFNVVLTDTATNAEPDQLQAAADEQANPMQGAA